MYIDICFGVFVSHSSVVSVSCCDAGCQASTILSNSYLYKLETEMPECLYILQISSCALKAINCQLCAYHKP